MKWLCIESIYKNSALISCDVSRETEYFTKGHEYTGTLLKEPGSVGIVDMIDNEGTKSICTPGDWLDSFIQIQVDEMVM